MKIPLRFQITEFDCGTVALQNAVSYLFERESIPAEVIKTIALYTLDCYDDKGNLGQGGTSRESIKLMTKWFTNYSNQHDFGIKCEHLQKEKVTLDVIEKFIGQNKCILVRTYLEGDHYVIITDVDDKFVYVWDSYYLDEEYYNNDNNVIIDLNNPFKFNRKISKDYFESMDTNDFTLGPIEKREIVLISREI